MTAALIAFASLTVVTAARAQAPEPRIALVIGNSSYKAGSLATPANDAGLIAQTLTQAGFEVVGARDLDQEGLRRSFRVFIEKAAASGPDTLVFVYLAGYGLQYSGENYFAPVEASIARDSSVPIEALRISDFTRALADLPLKARFVVLDAARANPFVPVGQPLAGGLALVVPEAGSLIAFNAAPGTIAPQETGDYGVYAKALSEMIHEGGLEAGEIFARTRLRVSETTRGAQVPWNATRLTLPVTFFERAENAPAPQAQAPRNRAIRDLPVAEAYSLALERDTIVGYQEFMTAYPRDPLSPRVAAMLAARREAITWRRAVARNTPSAYWSYIRLYPRGPHVADAHRRLGILSAAFDPPAVFDEYDFGIAPPPPDEYEYVSGPVMIFEETDYPPPPPIYFLPPRPREYIDLPPPRFASPGFLPVPIPIFLPSARPWRNESYRQPQPVRLPGGVTPHDPGAPPRFIAPRRPEFQQQGAPRPPFQPPQQQRPQPGFQTPLVSPQSSPQQQMRQREDGQRQQVLPTQQLQQQQQLRSQQVQQQRERQLRIEQQRVQQQQMQQRAQQQQMQQRSQQQQRAQQQQMQQRAQQQMQQRAQQQQQQRSQQQQMQQRAQQQQMQQRAQQQMQQRAQQQMQQRAQQQQQQRSQQQQMQQRVQQQQMQQRVQQQQMQQRSQQQQMQQQRQQQQQRPQQQQQQQQRQQPQQQQRQQRNDCGVPGKPACR